MKVTADHLAIMRERGAAYLAQYGFTFDDVKTGSDAWRVLFESGAYNAIGEQTPGGYPPYNDAHLRTALRAIMPNAMFGDK